MIDVYLREYARLECERLELDLGQPCEDEDQQLKGCYRNLGKRKFDRFITLYPARFAPQKREATALGLELLARKGIYIVEFFSSFIRHLPALRGPGRGAWTEGSRRGSGKFAGEQL